MPISFPLVGFAFYILGRSRRSIILIVLAFVPYIIGIFFGILFCIVYSGGVTDLDFRGDSLAFSIYIAYVIINGAGLYFAIKLYNKLR